MKPKHLCWLFVATLLIWFLPWQAKKIYPSIFGSAYVQWGSVIISAPLLALGMFLSIHALFSNPDKRRVSGWTCIAFIALFSHVIGYYCIIVPLYSRASDSIDTLSDITLMPQLIRKLHEEKTEEKRKIFAKCIYLFSGVSVPYQSEESTYIIYQPTEKDNESWMKRQQTEEKIKDTKAIMNWQISQLRYITTLYIGSFFITFFVGILILIYKNKKSEP